MNIIKTQYYSFESITTYIKFFFSKFDEKIEIFEISFIPFRKISHAIAPNSIPLNNAWAVLNVVAAMCHRNVNCIVCRLFQQSMVCACRIFVIVNGFCFWWMSHQCRSFKSKTVLCWMLCIRPDRFVHSQTHWMGNAHVLRCFFLVSYVYTAYTLAICFLLLLLFALRYNKEET